MSDADDSKGAPESAPSNGEAPESQAPPTADAQQQASMEELQRNMIRHIAGMIMPFCPNMDEAALMQLAMASIQEQGQVDAQILPTFMANNPASEDYPSIQAIITSTTGQEAVVVGPKRLEGVDDVGPAIQQALIFSLLLTPSARAVLKAWGFRLRFAQSKHDSSVPESKIKLM